MWLLCSTLVFLVSWTTIPKMANCNVCAKNYNRFKSPNYPQNYENNFTCTITLQGRGYVPMVVINFLNFSLEQSKDCRHDRLILDNIAYCGNDLQGQKIVRRGPVHISFMTNHNVTSTGFLAKYEHSYKYREPETCESLTNQQRGTVTLSSTSRFKLSRCVYEWPKKGNYNKIKIHFSYLNSSHDGKLTLHSSDHEYGKYKFHELSNEKSTYALPLKLSLQNRYAGEDFKMMYEYIFIPDCEKGSDYFNSPDYPKNYKHKESCAVSFKPVKYYDPPLVIINFLNFSLEKSENCRRDKLIMDNNAYCGNDLQGQKIVRRRPFDLFFMSDDNITSTGFYANYTFAEDYLYKESCELLTNKQRGSVTLSLPKNSRLKQCVYEWPQKDNYNGIMLHFNNANSSHSGNLYISSPNHDSYNYQFHELFNKTVVHLLPLELHLQDRGTGEGFKVTYEYLSMGGCDFQANATGGTLSSPNYPLNYGDNNVCIFEFAAKEFCAVQIMFKDFSLENSAGCENDNVEIANEKYCGEDLKDKSVTVPLYVHFPSTKIFKFIANGAVTGRGYRGTFKYFKNCSIVDRHNINYASGSFIKSPGFPKLYGNNLYSRFWIYGPYNFTRVEFKFITFQVESSADCLSDGLMIGNDRYCGTAPQGTTVIYDKPVQLNFYSNGSGRFKGFLIKLKYLTDEDESKEMNITMDTFKGNFSSKSKTIYDNFYYPSDISYKYLFPRKDGYCALRIYFRDFYLRYLNCTEEYVKFLNQTYCAKDLLKNEVFVQDLPFSILYVTQSHLRGEFYAEYEYTRSNCDRSEHSDQTSGLIVSPSYGNFKRYSNFTLKFNLTSGYCGVQLKFDDFALQYSPYCSADILKINGAPFCGDDLQHITVRYGLPSNMTLTYDGQVVRRGFIATYEYFKDCNRICNRDYYNRKGYITPTLMDDDHQANVYCSYVIHMYKNASCIKISFPLLNICQNNGYIKIDGKEYCGQQSDQPLTVIVPFRKDEKVFIGWKSGTRNNVNETFVMIYTQIMDENVCVKQIAGCDFRAMPEETYGTIQSPSFPMPDQKNFHCTYDFPKYDYFCGVELNFKRFGLQSSPRCYSDKLVIGHDSYCGQQLLNTKVSKFLPLTLSFSSEEAVNGNDFLADYTYLTDCRRVCKKDFHAKFGFITPQNGLFGSHVWQYCTYNIHRMAGTKNLVLNILRLDLCKHQQYIFVDQKKYCQIDGHQPLKVISNFMDNENIKELLFVNEGQSKTAGIFVIKYEQVTSAVSVV